MFELSYSKVRSYLNCPWLYKLKFIDDWKAPPSPDASLGISVHKALEKFHRELGVSGGELLACFDDVWERPGYGSSAEEFDFYERGREMLALYHREIASRWEGEILEVERELRMEFPELGVVFYATLDRLDRLPDGSLALVEYKTHAQAWDQGRLESDLQMTLYSRALRAAGHGDTARLFFFFVAQGRSVEVTRGPKDWEEALRTVGSVAESAQAARFEPRTEFCPSCEFNRTCPYSTVREK